MTAIINRQKAYVNRVNKLIDFMNYDYDSDTKWLEYLSAQQQKKLKQNKPKIDEKEEESLKRGYYGAQVDKEFEKTFEKFNDESERQAYFEYCTLYSQSFAKMHAYKKSPPSGMAQFARSSKQVFYFMFLLAFPLNIPYTPVLFLIAAICSIFEKSSYQTADAKTSLIARIFLDEEPLNLALLLLFLFSTSFVRFFLYLALILFAFLMWSEWAFELLQVSQKPGGKAILGLPAL